MSDEYCHLVVVDPDGSFVAYCECSIWRAEWQRSGQAIGWIDYVGTKPEHRRQGFGRSVLLAGLAYLRAWGADYRNARHHQHELPSSQALSLGGHDAS